VTTRRRADLVVVLVLAVAGFALSMVVHETVMPFTTGNADEVVYRFQADMYRDGLATIPDDGPVFRPWMSGVVDGERIMVFPPGWPAVMAAGIAVTGSETVTVAMVMALLGPAMWWFALELTRDRRVAAVAGVALLISPLVIVHSATLLSYLPALVCGLVLGAAVLRAARTGGPRVLVVGGLALGLLFAMRPLDAGLLAVPFGAYLLWTGWADRRWLARALGWGALGALPIVLLVFGYNARVSTGPLTFPIEAAGGNNAFGFGLRNIAEGTPLTEVSPSGSLRATALNLLELLQWIPGAWIGAVLAAVGGVILWRRDRAKLLLLVAVAAIFPLVYVVYWGTLLVGLGRDVFGPFYYAPVWMPVVVLVALAVVWLWDARRAVPAAVAAGLAVAATAVAVLGTTFALRPSIDTLDLYTERARAEVEVMNEAPPDSLVVLPVALDGPWILQPWGQYANTPALDGRIVFAADAPDEVIDAIGRFPMRDAYQLLAPDGPGNAGPLALEPLTVVTAPGFVMRVTVVVPGEGPVWSYAVTADGGARCPVVAGVDGTATVRWRLDGGSVRALDGCAGPVEALGPVPPGQRQCAAGRQVQSGGSVAVQEERFWCDTTPAGGGELRLVTPGEPRTGTPDGSGGLSWSALPRAEAESQVRVEIEANPDPGPSG
jgi:hypothetical protein